MRRFSEGQIVAALKETGSRDTHGRAPRRHHGSFLNRRVLLAHEA